MISEAFSVGDLDFRPVTREDMPLLADWLSRPHWREWWGEPGVELEYIRDMVEGRDATRPFLFAVEGVLLGYIQVWAIGPHQTPEWTDENPWLMALPANAVGIDLSVSDPERLSKGVGSRVLRAFAERVQSAGHRFIIIDPDPANGRAVAAYRKAGFRPIPELEGTTTDVLIMRFMPEE